MGRFLERALANRFHHEADEFFVFSFVYRKAKEIAGLKFNFGFKHLAQVGLDDCVHFLVHLGGLRNLNLWGHFNLFVLCLQ